MFGKSENREDYQHIERPAGGMARDLANHHLIDYHQHPRGQLIYAYSGAILVMTELGSWVVPPQRAVWVPPGMMHSMQACGNVEMRTVYVRQDHIPPELKECCVVSVPPLLRELIAAMVHIPLDYDEAGRDGLLVQLLLHEIKPLKVVPLHLPMPTDVRLGKICQRILAEPSDETTVDEWSKSIGASARTIVRLFPEQTGLTFSQWKQQARLLAAIQMLATNQNVTDIALQLGYESPSAFSAMFKRAIGLTPTEYFRELFPASE